MGACLAPSRAGKTPAYNMAFVKPISCDIKDNDDGCANLINDVTENGIFETIRSCGDSITPLLTVDKFYRFLVNIMVGRKIAFKSKSCAGCMA